MEDLEEAITRHEQALNLRPPGHSDCLLSLNNLAHVMFACFEPLGKLEDLEHPPHYCCILCDEETHGLRSRVSSNYSMHDSKYHFMIS
jgi:hypothetical protein